MKSAITFLCLFFSTPCFSQDITKIILSPCSSVVIKSKIILDSILIDKPGVSIKMASNNSIAILNLNEKLSPSFQSGGQIIRNDGSIVLIEIKAAKCYKDTAPSSILNLDY